MADTAEASAGFTANDILPGQYSRQGKVTALGLTKLREHVEAGDVEIKALLEGEQTQKEVALKSSSPPAEQISTDQLLNSSLRWRRGAKLSQSATLQESEFSRSMKEQWIKSLSGDGVKSPDRTLVVDDSSLVKSAQATAADQDDAASPTASPKPTTSFTTSAKPGRYEEEVCKTAGSLLKRFAFPAKLDLKPPLAHYTVSAAMMLPKAGSMAMATRAPAEEATGERYPEWEFGLRPKHLPAKPREVDTGAEPGEPFSSFTGDSSCSYAGEPMSLASERPALEKHTSYTEYRQDYTPWSKCDKFSSRIPRNADWDMVKHSGSHQVEKSLYNQYFEPGKYKVNLDMVAPVPKRGIPYEKARGRRMPDSKLVPKAILIPPGKALCADRSRFRGCAASVPRKTCTQDFSKDLDRPPMNVRKGVYYDEKDTEASQKVWEREMAFDASSADNFIVSRRDRCIDMHRNIPRQEQRGSRIYVNDPLGIRHSVGKGFTESSVDESTVESSQGDCTYQRPDVGLTFEQQTGRHKAPAPIAKTVYSSLGAPSDAAPFEFTRTALAGFSSSSSASSKPSLTRHASMPARSRMREHQELPDWKTISQDSPRQMPSGPPLKPGNGFRISAVDRKELMASYQAFCQASEGQSLSDDEFVALLRHRAPTLHLMVSSTGPEAFAELHEQFERAQQALAK